MKEFKYTMPKKIIPTKGIFEFITILYSTFKNVQYSKISLLSENTRIINPVLMAPLGLVLTKLKSQKNYIVFNKLDKLEIETLKSCGFLNVPAKNSVPLNYNTLLIYSTFSSNESHKFKNYIDTKLKLIDDLEKKDIITSTLYELYENVQMHNEKNKRYRNKEIFVSGYLRTDTNSFNFSISNNGSTFSEVITKIRGINYFTEYDYIKWALKESNTTRDISTTGGLGLFLLYELIKKCDGSLFIVSGKGLCCIFPNKKDYFSDLSSPFPGTSITVSLPLDKLQYIDPIYKLKNKSFGLTELFKEDI